MPTSASGQLDACLPSALEVMCLSGLKGLVKGCEYMQERYNLHSAAIVSRGGAASLSFEILQGAKGVKTYLSEKQSTCTGHI